MLVTDCKQGSMVETIKLNEDHSKKEKEELQCLCCNKQKDKNLYCGLKFATMHFTAYIY